MTAVGDDFNALEDLVARFSNALLTKLRLAQANGRSGWERDDWMEQCQRGLLDHVGKGDPRDVAAYCAFMWHHGWLTSLQPQPPAEGVDRRPSPAAWQWRGNESDSWCTLNDTRPENRESLLRRGYLLRPLFADSANLADDLAAARAHVERLETAIKLVIEASRHGDLDHEPLIEALKHLEETLASRGHD